MRIQSTYALTRPYHIPTEDEFMIVPQFGGRKDAMFAGVYDGHYGRDASAYAKDNLHVKLGSFIKDGIDTREALRRTFIEIDREIEEERFLESGTCAAVALILGNRLFSANAGDCRVLLGRKGLRAMFNARRAVAMLSRDHNLEDPEEMKRVTGAGGKAVQDVRHPDLLRVNGILAITRSLGDSDLGTLISPEPHIEEVTLKPDIREIVVASDGLFAAMQNHEVIQMIRREESAEAAVRELIERNRFKVMDDITVAVIKLAA